MVVTAQRDIDAAAVAAQCVRDTHFRLVEELRAGLTLAQIDQRVAEILRDLNCRSAFLGYKIRGHPPFPSHACLSLNNCIVHGTHDLTTKPIEPGDILSIDIGVKHDGWIGDAAWTYAIEHGSDEALRLMKAGRESLAVGIEALQPNRPLVDWARAVQTCVEKKHGFKLIRGLGGHGYGRTLHGPPFVSNVMPKYPGEWPDSWQTLKPGQLIAVEPMLAVGTADIRSNGNTWPIYTADGSLSVHYEANVLITPDGPRNLTAGMEDLPDVVGAG